MKTCKDIKDNLPLYLDDSLSDADKKVVEEHIKTCPQCTKTITQLSKTETLANSLTEVNPPPWLKYRIMARVREEAEKKSFVQKWFYPLQVKIPVQIFATICIAVLAVYIYRAGEERTKEIVPSYAPAPVTEVQKNQLPEGKLRLPAAPAPVMEVQKSKLPEEKLRSSADKAIQKEEQLIEKKEMRSVSVPAAAADAAKDVKQQFDSDKKVDRYESAPAAESVTLPAPALEKKKEVNTLGAAMKAGSVQQTQSSMIKPKILLRVTDLNTAADQVEKLLIKYEAQNINRHTTQGKTILSAQLKNQRIKDFMVRLKTIGQIEEGNIPPDNTEENITITIEILK